MSNAPFPIQPELTAIAIAYRNAKLIADEVLPRTPVGKQEFKYLLHTLADSFTVPDTKVGRKSRPNQVDFSATELPSSTEDFGLEDPIPQADIDNAPPNYDPLGRATEVLANLIALGREVRVAAQTFAAATYPAGNKVALSGTSQWTDPGSTPIKDIEDGLDVPIMRPTIAVLGQAAWSGLKQHSDVVKAVNKTAGDAGIAQRQAVAELFELDEIIVGQGWVNTAKKGQPATMVRVWGKHCALLHRDKLADTQRGATFGLTAQWGTRVAGTRQDPDVGLRGGQVVRAGESVKELITASDLGYFIENAVA